MFGRICLTGALILWSMALPSDIAGGHTAWAAIDAAFMAAMGGMLVTSKS